MCARMHPLTSPLVQVACIQLLCICNRDQASCSKQILTLLTDLLVLLPLELSSPEAVWVTKTRSYVLFDVMQDVMQSSYLNEMEEVLSSPYWSADALDYACQPHLHCLPILRRQCQHLLGCLAICPCPFPSCEEDEAGDACKQPTMVVLSCPLC